MLESDCNKQGLLKNTNKNDKIDQNLNINDEKFAILHKINYTRTGSIFRLNSKQLVF